MTRNSVMPTIAPERGFVLLAVLWVLVAMTVASTAFSLWVDRARSEAMELQKQVNAELAAHSAKSVILYTRLTGRAGPRGVEWPVAGVSASQPQFSSLDEFLSGAPLQQADAAEAGYMKLDNTVYAFGDLRFIAQDRGGLIGLTTPQNPNLFANLSLNGKGGQSLQDYLSDYKDSDSFRRLEGAEAPEYQLANRGAPADGALRIPLQLRDVIGWDRALAAKEDAELLELFRVDSGTYVNVNTAPPEALMLLLDSEQKAQALVQARKSRPFTSALDVASKIGSGEDLYFGIQPEPGLRFWWWYEGAEVAHVYDVQFAPLVSGRNAVKLNWYSRVALTDELKQRNTETVDHPLFEAPPDYRGW